MFFFLASSIQTNRTSWEEFYMDINERELYPENSQPLKRLLRDMAMLDIVHHKKKVVHNLN
ncbi:Golgi casein kinase, C-terminal, Fam20 [Dermatophagoides farinae]|uniref:Golgi casein kinase, C-terminal, Fam20 n=1 Tax=Dermatophagoides farinae TaxID=6954 RepID=A0A922L4Q1_DERFA|nr:Golgi casein kinase, C-terminal, Fam20 [Dermatophagoides farinae]